MEPCFQHPSTPTESSHEDIDRLKTASVEATGPDNSSGRFDCNICLDLVQDPVVTFCGHLYCWPCIYLWLQSQKTSSEDPYQGYQQPQCPVCKADVSQNTIIPLYAGGQSGKQPEGQGTQLGLVIPQRPNRPGCGVHTLIASTSTSSRSDSHPSQQHHYRRGYPRHQEVQPAFGFAGTTTFHPMIGMFGEMIYARLFRNSQTSLYTYPNMYSSVATTSSNARVRRHVMQAEKSLSRVSFFLFCCIILCLLLF